MSESEFSSEWVPGGSQQTETAQRAQSPAEGGGAGEGATESTEGFGDRGGGSSLTDRLFSTTPNVDVQEAAREFSTGSGWEGHASAAIQKLTGSEGTTALEHMILAVFLWFQANSDGLRETADSSDDGESGFEVEDDPRVPDGARQGAEDVL